MVEMEDFLVTRSSHAYSKHLHESKTKAKQVEGFWPSTCPPLPHLMSTLAVAQSRKRWWSHLPHAFNGPFLLDDPEDGRWPMGHRWFSTRSARRGPRCGSMIRISPMLREGRIHFLGNRLCSNRRNSSLSRLHRLLQHDRTGATALSAARKHRDPTIEKLSQPKTIMQAGCHARVKRQRGAFSKSRLWTGWQNVTEIEWATYFLRTRKNETTRCWLVVWLQSTVDFSSHSLTSMGFTTLTMYPSDHRHPRYRITLL